MYSAYPYIHLHKYVIVNIYTYIVNEEVCYIY